MEIRNLRREANDDLKKEERDGLGLDDAHRQLDQLQRLTDRFVADVDRPRYGEGARR